MSSTTTSTDASSIRLMQGLAERQDLFELVRLLVRTRKSGVLAINATDARAEVWLQEGAIIAAFFNEMAGSSALTRAILIGSASWQFDLHRGAYPRNITQATAPIIEAIERILAECGERLWSASAVTADGLSAHPEPEYAPAPMQDETLAIAAFSPPETGRIFGKCLLEDEIGRGASSVVYRARHRTLDLQVVVKVLMQSGDGDQHHDLSINEAQLLARMNHPHILRVFDFSDRGQYPHLIMEYVDGTSLAGLIEKSGIVPIEQALPIFCEVAEAMAYAHQNFGLVHCDIKPSNILLTSSLAAKVADFGLAKITRMSKSQLQARDAIKDHVAGTPTYIAPEQVQDGWDSATHRSDIYAFGATCYHALTGHPPFEDPDPVELMAKRLRFDPVPPHLVNPSLDRRLSDLVMSMLVRDPVHRIHTWTDLLGSLYRLFEAQEEESVRSGDGKIIRRRSSFWTQVPSMLVGKAVGEAGGATQAG